jgi:hypothetical protein
VGGGGVISSSMAILGLVIVDQLLGDRLLDQTPDPQRKK